MAGTDGNIGVDEPASIDKRLATKTQTRSGNQVHLEGVVFEDPVADRQARINANEDVQVADRNVLTAIGDLLTEATFSAEDFATQTTLEAARVLLAAIDTDLDVALSTRASESTVATLLTEATFTGTDFATQTTLEAARVLLASLDGTDFATQTTLASVLSELQSLSVTANLTGDHADLDSAAGTDDHEVVAIGLPGSGGHVVGGTATNPLRTDPTGSTTQPVSDATVAASVATLLTEATFSAENFATQATLEAARALLATIDADTSNLDVALSTRATEATVATLLTEATFAAEDFATQTTLEAARVLLASLNGKDFATQTTLAAVETAVDELETKIQSLVDATPALTLSARMFAKQPATGWRLWFDVRGTTAHSNGTFYLFIAEAAAADTGATGDHRGVRIPLSGSGGDMVGEVEENTAFTWDDRLTDNTGWT